MSAVYPADCAEEWPTCYCQQLCAALSKILRMRISRAHHKHKYMQHVDRYQNAQKVTGRNRNQVKRRNLVTVLEKDFVPKDMKTTYRTVGTVLPLITFSICPKPFGTQGNIDTTESCVFNVDVDVSCLCLNHERFMRCRVLLV